METVSQLSTGWLSCRTCHQSMVTGKTLVNDNDERFFSNEKQQQQCLLLIYMGDHINSPMFLFFSLGYIWSDWLAVHCFAVVNSLMYLLLACVIDSILHSHCTIVFQLLTFKLRNITWLPVSCCLLYCYKSPLDSARVALHDSQFVIILVCPVPGLGAAPKFTFSLKQTI